MNVLVVSQDVDELARAVDGVKLAFESEIHTADSAEEMRSKMLADGEPFDVIIVDGDLQPRGGYAALYEMRATEDLHGREPTPAIVLGERVQDVWLAQWARADGTVAKPVDPFVLARCARRAVRRSTQAA
ncbi:MAG: hypothetical protein WD152_04035 [Nitriliruptoraceae bacterium]